nr:thiol:disulfide interchange protein DsbA/DsbL [Methylomarinum sp. Ch1-1]MDP4522947.1 thiol:disulfide interchange protein DsbA/DsbL [Methylomarinum sp. Ch1-1]
MFFYGCRHCYALEADINAWADEHADLISFRRLPAIVAPSWITLAKGFFIAEQLGELDRLHPALYEAIHKQGEQFNNDYMLMKFFIDHGVKRQAFIEANNSKALAEKLDHARIMTVKYGLRGVPAIIVNGKFKTAPFTPIVDKKCCWC